MTDDATRSRLEVSVLPDRQPLFVKLSDGAYRNGYTLKILNMEREAKTFLLATEGLAGSELTVTGIQPQPSTSVELAVARTRSAPSASTSRRRRAVSPDREPTSASSSPISAVGRC